ncbi:hypothetical protein [Deinococcus hopiensis]|nr:hypothetical protein [Deinococcus hopiensis]
MPTFLLKYRTSAHVRARPPQWGEARPFPVAVKLSRLPPVA